MQAGILETMRYHPVQAVRRFLVVAAGILIAGSVTAIAQQTAVQTPPALTALPSGRDLATKHVKASGGEAAYKAVKSIHATGTFELTAQGVSGSLDMMAARPDKLLLRVEIASVGHVESGFDGKNGWSIDPLAGPTLLTGRALKEMAEDAWFDGALHGADHVKEMTTIARTEWDKKPAYEVRVVFNSGVEQTEYFDVETGLEIGSESQRETPMGVLPTKVIMRDHRKFGALLQPTVMVQSTMGIDQVFKIASYEYNTVPPATFDPPAVIKALIK